MQQRVGIEYLYILRLKKNASRFCVDILGVMMEIHNIPRRGAAICALAVYTFLVLKSQFIL